MFKPNDLVFMSRPGWSTRKRIVECISRPTPGDTIMVRMVPGEPTTMEEHRIDNLVACLKYRYLHVARVKMTFGIFPEDMLRYDCAFLFNHIVPEENLRTEEEVTIYRLRATIKHDWTVARWNSFSAIIKPLLTRDLRDPDSKIVKMFS